MAVLCLGAAAPAAGSGPRKCAGVEYSAGNGYYFYASTRVRATRAKCSVARKVARVRPGNGAHSYRSAGFSCHGRSKSKATVSFVCRRKRARVTFAWTTK
jgi:hypothetical protein